HTAIPRSRVLLVTSPVVRTGLEKINGRIAVSEAARNTLVEHIGGDAVVIPNGVAASRFRKAEPLPGWPGPGGATGFLGRMDDPAHRAGLSAAALAAVADYDWSLVARGVLSVYETVVLGSTQVAVTASASEFP